MSTEDNPRYVRKRLREIATKAKEALVFPENNEISAKCEDAASVLVQFVHLAADTGDFNFEYDVSTYNKASISKICEYARKELGDVHFIIFMGSSRRTITADWSK